MAVFDVITERKEAEKGLKEARVVAENRAMELQAVMDAVPALVLVTTDPEGRHMTGNRATYDLLKVPLQANISKLAPSAR